MKERAEVFGRLAESIGLVFWMSDVDKRVIHYVCPAYETIWGLACASLYANPRSWLDAIHPDDRSRVREAATTRQEAGEYDETYRVIRPDGTVRWIHDRAFPVRDDAGRGTRIAGVAEDVTDRRRLELSGKLADLGRLAAEVAHDFNNLLTPIIGHTELALADLGPHHPATRRLDAIHRAADSAATLVRQLLAVGRRSSGEPRRIALGGVVLDQDYLLKRLLGDHIAVRLDAHREGFVVFADPGQVSEVVLNLAVNARDAMNGAGGLLRISVGARHLARPLVTAHAEVPGGHWIVLEMADTGHGMDPVTQARIFEPFYTTKGAGLGTGLGLAAVDGIMHQARGFVTVDSAPGAGTTFRLWFPPSRETGD